MRGKIRPFGSTDAQAVREMRLEAFDGREDGARLVESPHVAGAAPVSLVAVGDGPSGGVVGHVLSSPVEIVSGGSSIRVIGLAPSEFCRSTRGRASARVSSVRDWRPAEKQPTMRWSCSGSQATTRGSASSEQAVVDWATGTA